MIQAEVVLIARLNLSRRPDQMLPETWPPKNGEEKY
jgi:hypothetical protein